MRSFLDLGFTDAECDIVVDLVTGKTSYRNYPIEVIADINDKLRELMKDLEHLDTDPEVGRFVYTVALAGSEQADAIDILFDQVGSYLSRFE